MDRTAICDFCLQFWTDPSRWHPAMNGFDRDIKEMEASASSGCHCCTIFLANTDLLKSYAEKLRLGNNNRIFVVFNEEYLSLGFLHSKHASGPLQFVMKSAEDLEPKLHSTQHEPFTGSKTSFTQAKEWLKNCKESHAACGSPKPDYYPTRLLHIDSKSQSIQLRHKESFPSDLKYATLSHCWGKAVLQCLKRSNIASFEEGIPFAQLAKTFQEAVTVCQELQLGYIWIDCFCIIQDSPQDWEAEALQMRNVYGNSFLNIAATDSEDSHGGLFRSRNVKVLEPFKIHLADLMGPKLEGKHDKASNEDSSEEESSEDETSTKAREQFERDADNPKYTFYLSDVEQCWDRFEQAPLNRRSWVLQERLLSPRVLHYDKDQLVWECDSLTACDRFPGPEGITGLVPDKKRIRLSIEKLRRLRNSDRPIGQELHDIWRPTIKTYTAAGLTMKTDRLIALEGIAQRLAQIYGCSYVAGLFTGSMESQLAWRLDGELENMEIRVPHVKIAPSWSWASFLGDINMLPQWDSVDSDQKTRRLKDHELSETILCEVTNKEQLAASWSPSLNFTEMPPLKIRCFMAQVHIIDFSETKTWSKGKTQMRVWRENERPIYSETSLPYQEDRPLDEIWPLAYAGGGGGTTDYDIWEGWPNKKVAVSSLANTQEDYFCVGTHLDMWKDFRKRRTFYLMPTYEVTKYEAQDIWEKVNVRVLCGLILERLEDNGNRFRRIGVCDFEARYFKNFWRAALNTDVPGLEKHRVWIDSWPDLNCEVKSKDGFVFNEKDDASQYLIDIV